MKINKTLPSGIKISIEKANGGGPHTATVSSGQLIVKADFRSVVVDKKQLTFHDIYQTAAVQLSIDDYHYAREFAEALSDW